MHSSATAGARPLRPRLWVPGLLYVAEDGELTVGSHVGYDLGAVARRHAPWARLGRVEDWTHRAWLVARGTLGPRLVDEHAIILPELLVDGQTQPHARRWLAEQPLLCVCGLKIDALVAAGIRVYQVEHDVAGDGVFGLSARGGTEPLVELRVPPEALRALARRQSAGRGALDQDLDPSLLGRVLGQLSAGVLTEPAVVHALGARTLIEEGYGYRGAPAGELRSLEAIARDVCALDAWFGQIGRRAQAQRVEALAVRSALPSRPVEADGVELPFYGRARRVTAPALRLACSAGEETSALDLRIGGQPQTTLELAAVDRWLVDDLARYEPELPADLDPELAPPADEGSSRAAMVAALFVLAAVAVALAAVAVAL